MWLVVWIMMGIAVWHFTVYLPDRFWGGIVGAFMAAVVSAAMFGFAVNGGTVPGATTRSRPGADRDSRSGDRARDLLLLGRPAGPRAGIDHGFTRAGSH